MENSKALTAMRKATILCAKAHHYYTIAQKALESATKSGKKTTLKRGRGRPRKHLV